MEDSLNSTNQIFSYYSRMRAQFGASFFRPCLFARASVYMRSFFIPPSLYPAWFSCLRTPFSFSSVSLSFRLVLLSRRPICSTRFNARPPVRWPRNVVNYFRCISQSREEVNALQLYIAYSCKAELSLVK